MFYKVEPREQSGRMTIDRFSRQMKATVIASLEILSDSEVVRLYCEYHDDYVVKRRLTEQAKYDFVQVKTNDKKELWSLNPLFGLNTKAKIDNQNTNAIKDSFIGKMIQHILTFGGECNKVIFQTNIDIDQNVCDLFAAIEKDDIDSKWLKSIKLHFNNAFECDIAYSDADINELLKKIHIDSDVSFIKSGDSSYYSIARDKIYEFSEIDLKYNEVKEIIVKLQALVLDKSSGPIEKISEDEVNDKASISLEEILGVLAISSDAYRILKEGGDSAAIKNASIIQRTFEGAGADEEMIQALSKYKNEWDYWVRDNRLDILDVKTIKEITLEELEKIIDFRGILKLSKLRGAVTQLTKRLDAENLLFDLDEKKLTGAFLSQIVRLKS